MHRIMHRSHVGDNRVVFADRVAALIVSQSPVVVDISFSSSSAMKHSVFIYFVVHLQFPF